MDARFDQYGISPRIRAALEWADEFVKQQVEPLDPVLPNPYDKSDPAAMAVFRKLREQVKEHGLWLPHVPADLGGGGLRQVELALLNEIIGRSNWAVHAFGYLPHETGIASILRRFGTEEHIDRYVDNLLDGEITACYSRCEPHVGGNSAEFRTRAVRDGDDWVITGRKWFNANARYAGVFLVIAVTGSDPDSLSAFLVDASTEGLRVERDFSIGGQDTRDGCYSEVCYDGVRVPQTSLLGEVNGARAVGDARGDSGHLHYAMRAIGQLGLAMDLMCARARTFGTRWGPLGSFQLTREKIADSWIETEQLRLLVMHTAMLIDQGAPKEVERKYVAAVKARMPGVLHDVVRRCMHLHGALGVSSEMPLHKWLAWSEAVAVSDGPTEVHKLALAEELVGDGFEVRHEWPEWHTQLRSARGERILSELS